MESFEEMLDSMKLTMAFNLRLKHPLAKSISTKCQELEALKQGARIATIQVLEAISVRWIKKNRSRRRGKYHSNRDPVAAVI